MVIDLHTGALPSIYAIMLFSPNLDPNAFTSSAECKSPMAGRVSPSRNDLRPMTIHINTSIEFNGNEKQVNKAQHIETSVN